jgi:hypothetical protein
MSCSRNLVDIHIATIIAVTKVSQKIICIKALITSSATQKKETPPVWTIGIAVGHVWFDYAYSDE